MMGLSDGPKSHLDTMPACDKTGIHVAIAKTALVRIASLG